MERLVDRVDELLDKGEIDQAVDPADLIQITGYPRMIGCSGIPDLHSRRDPLGAEHRSHQR